MGKVLVLGGGLSGLRCALSFRLKGEEVKLIDCNRLHEFIPGTVEILRNRVARHKLEKDIEQALKGTGIEFCLERVKKIEPDKSEVRTCENTHEYDKLVVALGSEIRENGYDTSSLDHVYSLSAAATLRDKIEEGVDVAVLGAGYVGLEVMGELAEEDADVSVFTSRKEPIQHANQAASRLALEYMERKDVEFRNRKELKDISGKKVEFEDGSSIEPDVVVWCKGRAPAKLVRDSFGVEEGGIKVNSDTEICSSFPASDYDDIYAVGDCASVYWRINSQDSISLGKTAIFHAGNRAYESRIFRFVKDFVRYRHFLHLSLNRWKIIVRYAFQG